MADRRTDRISSRKQPKQARSADLVAAILDAAVQVLAAEGAHRFTTARVADRAGVSIGSLYQYFPNKASILFRLQADEWRQTGALLRDILHDAQLPWLDRLHTLVETFIRSECEEAAVRIALGDAEPLYRDAPEARAAKMSGALIFQHFIEEVLPATADAERALAAELLEATMTQAGKQFSEVPRTPDEIRTYARAMTDMFSAYIDTLRRR